MIIDVEVLLVVGAIHSNHTIAVRRAAAAARFFAAAGALSITDTDESVVSIHSGWRLT